LKPVAVDSRKEGQGDMEMQPWKDDDQVDAAFTRLFSTLPQVEPSAAFIQRTVDAAWEARAPWRRWARWAAAAAALAVVAVASMIVMLGAPGWVVLTAAQVGTGSVMTFVWSATVVAEFWGLMVSAGGAVARVAVMPQALAALVATELLGAAALYSLHRLLRNDVRFRNSGPLCFF
jgi:hypothetical protein